MANIIKNNFSCKRDDLTIGGFEYLPADFNKTDGKKLAPVIMSHGFMSDFGMCDRYAQELAKEGYATFDFDFNGGGPASSLSNGETTKMSVLTEVQDLQSVVDFVCSKDYIDASKLVLLGCSQGGFVSALLSARLKEKVHALVMFYAALCIPDDARKGQMVCFQFDPANPPEIIDCGAMKLGKIYVQDVIKMDAFKEISAYKGPVCLIHGDADSVVNVEYSKKAYEVFTEGLDKDSKEYKSKELHIIKNGGHVFNGSCDDEAVDILKKFMSSLD